MKGEKGIKWTGRNAKVSYVSIGRKRGKRKICKIAKQTVVGVFLLVAYPFFQDDSFEYFPVKFFEKQTKFSMLKNKLASKWMRNCVFNKLCFVFLSRNFWSKKQLALRAKIIINRNFFSQRFLLLTWHSFCRVHFGKVYGKSLFSRWKNIYIYSSY